MRRFSGKVVVLLMAVVFTSVFGLATARAQDITFDNQPANAIGQPVTFTVSINDAPNAVEAIGFDITFDATVLQFAGSVRGALVTNWDQFSVESSRVGTLTVGGFTTEDIIAQGASGELVQLNFTVLDDNNTTLSITNPVDDVETWTFGEGELAFNVAPMVDAGEDQTITRPDIAILDGTVTDDGLPVDLTITWSQRSGPGTVTFGNANARDTIATFSAAGTYVLRLTAHDGQLTSFDEVTITVNDPVGNTAPMVNAGEDQTITQPDPAELNGRVTDDDLPDPPGTLTITWEEIDGPGTVTFGNANARDTTATFSAAGTYVLRLTAHDGQLASFDDVTITVVAENRPPTVNAGSDQEIIFPKAALLDGTVSDDGLPDPPGTFTTTWEQISGPGTVSFADDSAVDTTATFSATGIYILRLTADDEARRSSDNVTITVTSLQLTLITPQAGNVVAGDAVALLATSAITTTTPINYQFRSVNTTNFTDIGQARLPTPVPWDTTAQDDGGYRLRAVSVSDGLTSEEIQVRINNTDPSEADIFENTGTKTQRVQAGQDNTIITSGNVRVDIPADALEDDDALIVAEVDPDDAPGTPPADPASLLVDVTLQSGATTFNELITVTIPYADANQDGIVDDTTTPETMLTMWFFDDVLNEWFRIPRPDVDPVANTISAQVDHVAVLGAFDVSLPLEVTAGAQSPSADITVTTSATNLPVLQLQLDSGADRVTINTVRVNFSDFTGEASTITLLRVMAVNDTNGNGAVNNDEPVLANEAIDPGTASVTLTLDPALVIRPDSTENLLIALNVSTVTGAAAATRTSLSPATPASPTRFAWLVILPPALGIVLLPRRRRSAWLLLGVLILTLGCSVVLTSCSGGGGGGGDDDDEQQQFAFAVRIPANGLAGQGAAFGPFSAPAAPIAGPTITVSP